MVLCLWPLAQHDGAEGASSTLPSSWDFLAPTLPSRPLHHISATPQAGLGGCPPTSPGTGFTMTPYAPTLEMSQQPHPPLMRLEKISPEKERRKEGKSQR